MEFGLRRHGWLCRATEHVRGLLVEGTIRPRLSLTQEALFRSQGGPLAGVPFVCFPTSRLSRMDSSLFHVLLLQGLWLPLPPSSRSCRCGRRQWPPPCSLRAGRGAGSSRPRGVAPPTCGHSTVGGRRGQSSTLSRSRGVYWGCASAQDRGGCCGRYARGTTGAADLPRGPAEKPITGTVVHWEGVHCGDAVDTLGFNIKGLDKYNMPRSGDVMVPALHMVVPVPQIVEELVERPEILERIMERFGWSMSSSCSSSMV